MRGACAGGGGARGRRSGHRGMSCAGPGSVRDARSPVCRTRTFGVPDTHIPAPHRARFRRGAAGRTAYRVTRLEQQQRAVRPEQHAQGNTPRGLRAAGRAGGGLFVESPWLCAQAGARGRAPREGRAVAGNAESRTRPVLPPPPLPTVAPTHVPTVQGGGGAPGLSCLRGGTRGGRARTKSPGHTSRPVARRRRGCACQRGRPIRARRRTQRSKLKC